MNWDLIRDMLCKADGLAKEERRIHFENVIQDIAYELGFNFVAHEPLKKISKDEWAEYVEDYR